MVFTKKRTREDDREARQVPLDDVRAALRGGGEAHPAQAGVAARVHQDQRDEADAISTWMTARSWSPGRVAERGASGYAAMRPRRSPRRAPPRSGPSSRSRRRPPRARGRRRAGVRAGEHEDAGLRVRPRGSRASPRCRRARGMLRSISTTSGSSSRASSTASLAVARAADDLDPPVERRGSPRAPRRRARWSSAMRTRIGRHGCHGTTQSGC